MKLTDLNPRFIGAGGDGVFVRSAEGILTPAPERHGVGVTFNCPCGQHEDAKGGRCFIPFANPLDGGPQYGPQGWTREGDTFETLTLRPSILRKKWTDRHGREHGCGWHGFITNGEIQTC